MLALVPAMIAGFRLSRQGEAFNPEANRYREGARFLSVLLEERPALEVEIGLCAHRAGVSNPLMPEHVSSTGAHRMVAFVAALLDNSRAGRRTVSVSQQTATDRAAGTVNSLVFRHYALEAKLEHLLRAVDQHADDIRAVLARHDTVSATRFGFTPLDPFSELVERDMEEVFGPDWTGAATDPRWSGGWGGRWTRPSRRRRGRWHGSCGTRRWTSTGCSGCTRTPRLRVSEVCRRSTGSTGTSGDRSTSEPVTTSPSTTAWP
ncbi:MULTISPECIES: hypothetical protein [unclassified Streptomyces]|uniref:hypothetical protein n=1 Tax=unclassified Streptomyces TaxID=2593676 RepID=UPI0033319F62